MDKSDEQFRARMGEVIKRERIAQKLSREELAEKAKISSRYLAAIENGDKNPRPQTLSQIITALDISADYIFNPKGKTVPSADVEQLLKLIMQCSARERMLIKAIVVAIIDNRK